MSVRINSQVPRFIKGNKVAMERALRNMALDIERLAKAQVPHDTGALENSIRPLRIGELHYHVDAGSVPFNIPYARRWEFETPKHGFKKGRKSRYLRDPGEQIRKNALTYFKQAAREVAI